MGNLGKGAFGCVKLVERVSTGEKAALKMIEYRQDNSPRQLEYIRREIAALQTVQHENILSLRRLVERVCVCTDGGH